MQEAQSSKPSSQSTSQMQVAAPDEVEIEALVLPPAPEHSTQKETCQEETEPARTITINRASLEALYYLAAACPEKKIEQARAVLDVAKLLGLQPDFQDKTLWMCTECGEPLGEEGAWDSYHDDGYEVYHTDCCPCCSYRHLSVVEETPQC